MSFVLGLTGPTGSGKGVFSDCAREIGFNVIDCDAIARKAVKKGMPALRALTEAFGTEILKKNGELDRKKLADIAFSSYEKTELLNQTVLPFIKDLVTYSVSGDLVLLDAPTLFESGVDSICDMTVAVTAPEDIRKKRIISRDKLDEASADMRISAGKPDSFYVDRVDYMFKNNGDIENFKKQVKIYLINIVGGIKDE